MARIYKRPNGGGYRLYWRIRGADGKPKSRMRDFTRYAKAKHEGDELLKDLAKGSQVTALTQGQAGDVLDAQAPAALLRRDWQTVLASGVRSRVLRSGEEARRAPIARGDRRLPVDGRNGQARGLEEGRCGLERPAPA